VLLSTAVKGDGIDEIVAALDAHWDASSASGALDQRRRDRLARATRAVVGRAVERWLFAGGPAAMLIADRLAAVVAGTTSPYDVAAEVVAALKEGVQV
jgi:LAO/AO transport system kinase